VFNDSERLDSNAGLLAKYLRANPHVEVIVVDDGSSELQRAFLRGICDTHGFRLLSHSGNRGKWAAIRTGAMQSNNSHIVICDADCSSAPWITIRVYEECCRSSDVMVGDRNELQEGIPFYRLLYGWCFNKIVQVVIGGVFWKFSDTQCPAKVFPINHALVAYMEEQGFAGDVEWILRYSQSGYNIVSVDVPYMNDRNSKVHPFRDGARMFTALFRIRRRWL